MAWERARGRAAPQVGDGMVDTFGVCACGRAAFHRPRMGADVVLNFLTPMRGAACMQSNHRGELYFGAGDWRKGLRCVGF